MSFFEYISPEAFWKAVSSMKIEVFLRFLFFSLRKFISCFGIFALNDPLAASSCWTEAAICSEGFPPLSRSNVDN
jgi:hypothetical protein